MTQGAPKKTMTLYLTILVTSILVGLVALILIETQPRQRKAFITAAIANAIALLLLITTEKRRK